MQVPGARTSLLSVAGAVALDRAGVEPLGAVTGCVGVVVLRTWANACGSQATTLGQDAPRTAVRLMTDAPVPGAAGTGTRTPASRLGARRQALRDALDRMLERAAALGADGVLDVRLTETPEPGAGHWRAVAATGTAVRVRGGVPDGVPVPFASTLDGPGTAAAIGACRWPARVAVGLAAAVRHTDPWARVGAGQQLAVNEPGELEGLTELLTAARAAARDDLAADAARAGDGHVVLTRSEHRSWRQEVAGHTDDVAEATLVGTVLHDAGPPPGPGSSLAVLPLTDSIVPDTRRGGRR